MLVLWIVVAVVVLSLIVLGVVVVRLLGRLGGLERALRRLQRREAEARGLQAGAETLQATLAGLQERAGLMGERIELVKAGRGARERKPVFLRR